MADPVTATLLIVSAASSVYGHSQQKAAAKAATKTEENRLERKIKDERNVLRENTKRRLADRDRYLSKVRVQNAASGFANSGTQLAVFGDIESRLDDQVEEATSRAFASINNSASQIQANRFALSQRKKALNTQLGASLVSTAVGAGRELKTDFQRTGNDPFSLFS